MFNMFRRALAGQQLAPVERAVLRLVEGLLATAIVAAAPIVADALAQQHVNWGAVVRAALAAASVAVLLALAKYARAHGDPQLGKTLEAVAVAVPARLGVNDVKLLGESIPLATPAPDAQPLPVAALPQESASAS